MADSEEIARLQAAVEQLSARIARLEQRLGEQPVAPSFAAALPVPKTSFGLKVINRVGALTLAIGVIFFFKYAVDENLIGPSAGVVLGIALGAVLLAAGERLTVRGQTIFAQGVSGCGLAIIYISVYASFAFYKLVPEWLGFFALVLVSALALAVSIRYRNPAIAALGFIGALLTPILLHTATSEIWLGFLYLVLVGTTSIVISIRESWAILPPIVAPLSLLSAAILVEPKHSAWFATFAFALSLLHFAGTAWSRGASQMRNSLYLVGHCCLLLGGLRTLHLSFLQAGTIRELDTVLLALYGIAVLAYGLIRSSVVDRSFGLALLGLVIAKLYLADVWVLARIYRITAFVGLGVLLLIASYIYSRSDKRQRSSP